MGFTRKRKVWLAVQNVLVCTGPSIFICIPQRHVESESSNFCSTPLENEIWRFLFFCRHLWKICQKGPNFVASLKIKFEPPPIKKPAVLRGGPSAHTPRYWTHPNYCEYFNENFYLSTTHKDSGFYSLNPSRPGDLKEAFNVCELDEESQVCVKSVKRIS